MGRSSRDQRGQFSTMVRYDGRGRIIPGSNILKKGQKPQEGTWQKKNAYECCDPVPTPPFVPSISWIQTQTFPKLMFGEGLNTYAFASKDSSGNVWTTSTVNSRTVLTQTTNLSKFNPEGELLFTRSLQVNSGVPGSETKGLRGLSIVEASDFMYFSSVFVAQNNLGPLESSYWMIVIKVDSEGVILGEVKTKIGGTVPNQTSLLSYEFNKSLVGTDDVLYTLFSELPTTGDTFPNIISHDSNLTMLANIQVESNTTDYSTLYNSGIINNQGYLQFGYTGDWVFDGGDNYSTDIITLDRNLNIISSFLVNPTTVPIYGDFDSKAIVQDSTGAYLQLGYDYDLHKYDVNTNEFIWYLENTSSNFSFENIVLDSEDNMFIISENYSEQFSEDAINILKLSSSGEVLFQYNVEFEQDDLQADSVNPSVVDNNLILYSDDNSNADSYIFNAIRLPLTEPIPGEYVSENSNFNYAIVPTAERYTLVQNPGGAFALSDVFRTINATQNINGITSTLIENMILNRDLTKLP